jgi:fucose permease
VSEIELAQATAWGASDVADRAVGAEGSGSGKGAPLAGGGGGSGGSGSGSSGGAWREWRIILITATLLGVYVGAETGFGGFLVLYATRGPAKLSEASGQYVTAVYWGFLAVGRLAAIPLSLAVKVSAQLLANVAVCSTGVALLVLGLCLSRSEGGEDSEWLLWLGAAVYGFGMASVFPSAFMQAEALMDLTGRAASVLMVGAAFGEMAIPLAVGLVTHGWAGGFVLVVGVSTLFFSATSVALVVEKPRPAVKAASRYESESGPM